MSEAREETGSAPRPKRQAGARFLVLDGVDGCGKSTLAARLCGELERAGRAAPLHLREPGSTAAGEAIREIALSRRHALVPQVEALLMAAARRQMLDELVAPALAAGRDVVCERFHPSTWAYQGVAGGVGEARIVQLLQAWANAPAPDLVLILDLSSAQALERRGAARDRIEAKGAAYQQQVAEAYRRYAQERPFGGRVVRIDASRPLGEVAASAWAEVSRVL
ncbi:MAG: dTMP kinase [Planctomycetes bacterium]|nr:dTMP kinase [Planctomycetota bacterium]